MSTLATLWRDLQVQPRDSARQLAVMQSLSAGGKRPPCKPLKLKAGQRVQVCAKSEYLRDVVETLSHALTVLGYQSEHRATAPEDGQAAVVLERALWVSPRGAARAYYNVEQMAQKADFFTSALATELSGGVIWDYSAAQCSLWPLIAPNVPICHVPFGFAPVFPGPDPVTEDIDVLFFGSLSPRRQAAIDALTGAGLTVEARDGLFGAERESLIARAKVVLVWAYERNDIFDAVRIIPLLARTKAVISDIAAHTDGQGRFDGMIQICKSADELVTVVQRLCTDPQIRTRMAAKGFAALGRMAMHEHLAPVVKRKGLLW